LETLLRWAALWLARILNKYGDPTLQTKLDAFNKRVAEAEQREKDAEELVRQSAKAFQESVESRKEWQKLLTESQAKQSQLESELRASQERVIQIQDEARKAKEILNSRSDADVLRDPL